MTRRERLERKLERRREWAEKAKTRADALSEQSHKMMSVIPMGQPILVGHHSEKRDRAYRERAWNKMGKAVEQRDLAEHHVSKAGGLEHQLDRAIFSDDSDAVQELEIRIANNETKRCHMKEVNRLYRIGDAASLAGMGINLDTLRTKLAAAGSYWGSAPHLPYELSNLGQRIAGDKKRLEQIKAEQARHARAAEAPNGVMLEPCDGGYCRVTFAEKPDRSILDALRAAGFFWCKGHWGGKLEQFAARGARVAAGEASGGATMSAQTGYLKRAVKYPGGEGIAATPYLDCECGERIPMPRINGLPMTYVCGKCGLHYGPTGWIISRPETCSECGHPATLHDVAGCTVGMGKREQCRCKERGTP